MVVVVVFVVAQNNSIQFNRLQTFLFIRILNTTTLSTRCVVCFVFGFLFVVVACFGIEMIRVIFPLVNLSRFVSFFFS